MKKMNVSINLETEAKGEIELSIVDMCDGQCWMGIVDGASEEDVLNGHGVGTQGKGVHVSKESAIAFLKKAIQIMESNI